VTDEGPGQVRSIRGTEHAGEGSCARAGKAGQDPTQHELVAEENRLLAERLTMTLESLTDVFFTLDREFRFTYLNGEAERLLHRRKEDLLGQVLWEQFPEALGTVFEHEYRRALRTGTKVEFESCYPPLNAWVQVRAYPSEQGLAVSCSDVTEKLQAQREVLRLNAELEERVKARTEQLQAANRELEAFACSVAHDLRAPMAAISAFAHVLETTEGARLTSQGLGHLQRIRAAASQLNTMTVSMLELARLSRTALRREPVDLGRLALEILAGLADRESGRRVDIRVAEGLHAEADPTLVRQVLANLLDNAWKFTARTPQARIEVFAQEARPGERVFVVRDNGAGFDMRHAEQLFEPFRRLHGQHEFEGSGIGLATVHRIVSRHQGRIWAEASVGAGASFLFTLGA